MKYVHENECEENECEVKIKTFRDLLIDLKACKEGREWAKDKSIENVVEECEKIKWLCWLSNKLQIDNQLNVLAAGLIANQVRHLLVDEISIKAIDAVISFGSCECSIDYFEELKNKAASRRFANNEVIKAAENASWGTIFWARCSAFYAVRCAVSYSSVAVFNAEPDPNKKELVKAAIEQSSLKIYKDICGDAIIKKVNEILS